MHSIYPNRSWRWLCCSMLTILSHITVAQSSRYVSPAGNDAGSGTLAQPWKTIQKAANSAPAGSTVYIMGGTYIEQVEINVSGTSGAYTVFRNYDANPVILSGNGQAAILMKINGVSYVEIRGLQFQNCLGSVSAGIQVLSGGWRGPAHHIRLIGNSFKNLYASADTTTYAPNIYAGAISVAGYDGDNAISHVLIDSNAIADCRTGWTEAIGITGNVDGFVVSNNTVTNTGNIGIDASGHWGQSPNPATDFARNGIIRGNHVYNCRSLIEGGAGIYLDGSSGMLVEQNTVHNNAVGIAIGCEPINKTIGNNIIRNNVSYNNDGYGIGVAGWSPENRIIENCSIINNTTYGNAQKAEFQQQGELAIFNSKNLVVKNNIFYATNGNSNIIFIDDNPVNLQLEHNIYYSSSTVSYFSYLGTQYGSLNTYQSASGKDNNSSFVNPLYVNTYTADFHLQGASPGIDATNPSYNPASGEKDRDGNNRKHGIAVDNGAYEFNGTYGTTEEKRFLNTGIVVNAGTVVHAGSSVPTFVNNGSYDSNAGVDIFLGTAGVQEIAGSVAPAFGELIVSNGSAALFNISNDNGISISRQLTLNNGITTTVTSRHQNGAIRLADNATVVATISGSRHVNGYVTKTGNDAFTFPLGNGSQLRSLQISAPSSVAATLTAAWLTGSPASVTDPSDGTTHPITGTALGGNIVGMYSGGSWDWISNNVYTNTLTVTVLLPDLSGFANATALRLVGWNGRQWIPLNNASSASGNTEGSTLQGFISPDSSYTALGIGKISETGPVFSKLDQTITTDVTQRNIIVFPNPTQHEVRVSGLQKNEAVKLFDMQGRLLLQKTGNSGTLLLSLETLAEGCYILRVDDRLGSPSVIKKIFKQ